MALIPPFLAKGDTVIIIASARARSEKEITPAINLLKAWGLQVEIGKNTFNVHHQFAGTDEERAEDLRWAINHPLAKAIIFSGGGYGSLRIVDLVNFAPLLKQPKWIVGYSDVTVFHSRLNRMGIASLHATLGFQFERNAEATETLRKRLFGEEFSVTIEPNILNRTGDVNAEVVGGNLSILYALAGSRDDLVTRNKILFIEDLDEQLYHLDRMMLQLKRSNKLNQLAGVVVGGMTEMKDNTIAYGKTAEEIIWDSVKEYDYPLCFNFPAGHLERNLAIYFGKKVNLVVDSKGSTLRYT